MKLSAKFAIQKESLVYGFALLLLLGFTLPVVGQAPDDATEGQRSPEAGIATEAGGQRVDGLTGTTSVVLTEEGQQGTIPALLERLYRLVLLAPRGPIGGPGGEDPLVIAAQIVEALVVPGPLEEGVVVPGEGGGEAVLGDRDWLYTKDVLMPIPGPTEIAAFSPSFATVARAFWQNARAELATEGGISAVGAFSYAEDGTQAGTMKVRLIAFDQDAAELFHVTVDDDLTTFPGDPFFSRTGLAVDHQGRSTVAYTELFMGTTPRVLARRVDVSGAILDATPIVINPVAIDPSAALLDPAGDRLVIVSTDFASIKGNVLDTTGGTPAAGPQFQISTTPGNFLFLPSVASNPATGEFLVVWEHLTGTPGNPQNVRARRFDSSGMPAGPDFQVNTFETNAQGQPAVAFGPNGESVVVWAGDAPNPGVDFLDVFFQAYDSNGDPIGGEQRANSFTADFQDRPDVKFLPDLDAQGNVQFAIYWRDVGNPNGSLPRGTGTSYARFSIAGPAGPDIFADGFETGDTSAWSSTTP